jgi:Protein of unknown function (DUF3572)
MTKDEAKSIASLALGYLAEAEESFAPMVFESGLNPRDLTTGSDDPAVLGGVLDHLLQDEETLMSFCENHNIAPELVYAARELLPGGLPSEL